MSQSGILSFDPTIVPIETLTGNSGGAVSPDASGNLDILGNNTTGINVVGTPGSNLLTIIGIASTETQVGTTAFATAVETGTLVNSTKAITPAGLAPILISQYIVAPGGAYTTIQSAINAANAAGGGTVIVRYGPYTENLTLYDKVDLRAVPWTDASYVSITGQHTAPATGIVQFEGFTLIHPTAIFNDVAAKNVTFNMINTLFLVTSGTSFNIPNFAGTLNLYDCVFISGDDSIFNNSTGSMALETFDCALGIGANTGTIQCNGLALIDNSIMWPKFSMTGSNSFTAANGSTFHNTLTFAGSTSGVIYSSQILSGTAIAITQNSSGSFKLGDLVIDSSAANVITGTGTVVLGSITYITNSTITGVTKTYGTVLESGTGFFQNLSFNRGTNTISTNGQLIIGNTGNNPSISTLTAGTGIAISNGAGSITISTTTGGFAWTDVTGPTQTIVAENGYIADRGGGVAFTLPASATIGDEFRIVGLQGSWTLAQAAGQQIKFGNTATTVGATGSLASTDAGDCIECVATNTSASTIWRVMSSIGNITVA